LDIGTRKIPIKLFQFQQSTNTSTSGEANYVNTFQLKDKEEEKDPPYHQRDK